MRAGESRRQIVGWLYAVDPSAETITVSEIKGEPSWSPEMTFVVDGGTSIMINGEPSIITELVTDCPVRVWCGFKDGNDYAEGILVDTRPRKDIRPPHRY